MEKFFNDDPEPYDDWWKWMTDEEYEEFKERNKETPEDIELKKQFLKLRETEKVKWEIENGLLVARFNKIFLLSFIPEKEICEDWNTTNYLDVGSRKNVNYRLSLNDPTFKGNNKGYSISKCIRTHYGNPDNDNELRYPEDPYLFKAKKKIPFIYRTHINEWLDTWRIVENYYFSDNDMTDFFKHFVFIRNEKKIKKKK